MDIPLVLSVLRPGEDWGPCAQSESAYEDLAATWRGTSACPTMEEMQATWTTINAAATREAAIKAIDAQCEATIAQGFAFAGRTFSLSAAAQMNWTNMFIARSLLTYPLEISTKDDGKHTLADASEVAAFYTTGIGVVKAAIDTARAAKLALPG
jgi:hypothetical protein